MEKNWQKLFVKQFFFDQDIRFVLVDRLGKINGAFNK